MINPSFLRSINIHELIDRADTQRKRLKVRFIRNFKKMVKTEQNRQKDLKKTNDLQSSNKCSCQKRSKTSQFPRNKKREYAQPDEKSLQTFRVSNDKKSFFCKQFVEKPKTPLHQRQVGLKQNYLIPIKNNYDKPYNFAFFKEINFPQCSQRISSTKQNCLKPMQQILDNKSRIQKKLQSYSRFIGNIRKRAEMTQTPCPLQTLSQRKML